MTRLRNAKPERLADGLMHVRVRIQRVYPKLGLAYLGLAALECGHTVPYVPRFRYKTQSTLICPECTAAYRARVGGVA